METFLNIISILLALVVLLALPLAVIFVHIKVLAALFAPRTRFDRALRLAIVAMIVLATFIEKFWAIPAYLLVTWIYLHTYSSIEKDKLKPLIARITRKGSRRYYQVLLAHRLIFLGLFMFLGSIFLATWDLHNYEDVSWAWWAMVFFAVFRQLIPLIDGVLIPGSVRRPRFIKLVFFSSVVGLAFGVLWLGQRYADNSFLVAFALTMAFTTMFAALVYEYPNIIKYATTKLNKQGLTEAYRMVHAWVVKLLAP